jgi:hypothetical protein
MSKKTIFIAISFFVVLIVFFTIQFSVYKNVTEYEKKKVYNYITERMKGYVDIFNELENPSDSSSVKIRNFVMNVIESLDKEIAVIVFVEDAQTNTPITERHYEISPYMNAYYDDYKDSINIWRKHDVFSRGSNIHYVVWEIPEENPKYKLVCGMRDEAVLRGFERNYVRMSIIISSVIVSALFLLLMVMWFELSRHSRL